MWRRITEAGTGQNIIIIAERDNKHLTAGMERFFSLLIALIEPANECVYIPALAFYLSFQSFR